ncbi:MAG: ketopantoate reductase family protein [Chloroflexi bacterium]|nr:ketopantoate reductase family protein [Chloroflexota bacterium]
MTSHTNNKQRLLLMGCGGVGGVIAGGLLRAGHNLTIVTHNETICQAIGANQGLGLATPDGQWTVPAPAHVHLNKTLEPFDAVYMAMKGTGVEQAARDVKDYLAPEGYAVTFQNGVVEDRVSAILGRERVIGALVGWGATMHAPGVYEMTSHGENVIGELDGQLTPRVRQLKATLESVAPTTASTNIYGILWSKLTLNCATSATGAVTGQLLGEMLWRNAGRRLALAIFSEVVDVAQAHGISLEPVGGTLDVQQLYLPPHRRGRGVGLDLIVKHAIMLIVGSKFRRLKSSMLQSIERGRRAEIDFLNGYVAERGKEKGVPTPINTALTTMVREVEAGTRQISPDNLAELLPCIEKG